MVLVVGFDGKDHDKVKGLCDVVYTYEGTGAQTQEGRPVGLIDRTGRMEPSRGLRTPIGRGGPLDVGECA